MTNAERAKQFASGFDPLKGFQEVLRETEKIYIPHAELTEDRKAELDYIISSLRPGQMIEVVYYHNGEYLKITGMVAKIDCGSKMLTVVNRNIPIKDIYDIEIIS